ncbi:MAG: nitronate monooxygenase, partial [Gammaproteobacteria bacterium]|nr:nitronate monooxygenase [Gammaproteobacteria bacterium]
MLGAQGAWIGSAFLASEEANIFGFQKQAIVDATEEGTTISRSVTGKPARIIRSKWTDYWAREGKEPLPMPFQGTIAGPVMAAANRDGRGDINPGFAGQGIGMIKAVRPAKQIFDELVLGTQEALARAGTI